MIAAKEFNKVRQHQTRWQAIIRSKDRSAFLVFFEDDAAVPGHIIVAICVYTSHRYNLPCLDGVASMPAGVFQMGKTFILARESRSLLMGEDIAPSTQQKINTLIQKDPAVFKPLHILSTYQLPVKVLLVWIVAFKPHLDTTEIDEAIVRIRATIKDKISFVSYILIKP